MKDVYKELARHLARELHYPSELIGKAALWAVDDLVGTGMDVFHVDPAGIADRVAEVLDANLGVWGVGIKDELNAYGRSVWVSDVARAFGKAQAACRDLATASVL